MQRLVIRLRIQRLLRTQAIFLLTTLYSQTLYHRGLNLLQNQLLLMALHLPSASIINGVGINAINPNQTVTIIFQVQIVSNPTTFTPELQNLGFVNFQYNVGNALLAQPGNVEQMSSLLLLIQQYFPAVKLLIQPLQMWRYDPYTVLIQKWRQYKRYEYKFLRPSSSRNNLC